MKIEKQITSVEISKKLKELGMIQDSIFYWWKLMEVDKDFTLVNPSLDRRTVQSYIDAYPTAEMYSAFTVSELGEILPINYYTMRNNWGEWTPCFDDKAVDLNKAPAYISNAGINEVDLRGKMIIHLIGTGNISFINL